MPEFDAHKFAKQVTEVAERVADVSDAARGKARKRSGGLGRWLILPVAGAAVYAAAKRASAAGRSTDGVVRRAEGRAGTPDMDLLNRVKDAAGFAPRDEYERRDAQPKEKTRAAASSISTRGLDQHRRERVGRRRDSASAT
jgi:hypothetical protein